MSESSEAVQGLKSPEPRVVAGELLVKLRQPLASSRFEAAGYTLRPVKELAPHLWLMRLEGGLELHDTATLAADTLQAVTALAEDPRVAEISENSRIPYARVPSDPLYPSQIWNYDTSLHLPQAWDITTGQSSVRIAILDSGRTEHPDLLWGPGKDFVDGNDDPTAEGTYHHGIHVAGVVGAQPNNGRGGVGVCWGCTIIPLRTGDTQGNVRSAVVEALRWAGGQITPDQNGPRRADIVNLSMSEKTSCNLGANFAIRDAIDFAVAQGVTVVVAAGNFGSMYDAQFPANCNNSLAVGASAPGGARASYSTQGYRIDITAPGGGLEGTSHWGEDIGVSCPRYDAGSTDPWLGTQGVVSTWTAATATPGPWDHCYRYLSGTSLAAPHVAGVLGLMLSVNPGLTPAQLKEKLKSTARPMTWTECPGGGCGTGLVDAYAAVRAARGFDLSPTSLAFGDVRVGTASDQTVAVTNIGTAPLTLSIVSVTGAAFSWVNAPTGPIAPGTSANLTLRCVPSSAVFSSGTLALSGNGIPASVGLSCRGVAPVLSVSPAGLVFGDVPVNTAVGRVATLTNTGTAPLTVSNFSLGGGPFYPNTPLTVPGVIPPGGSVNFQVTCQPPWISTYTGTLSFVSDGGNASVSLSCRGYAAEIRAQEFVGFGDVRVGEAADRPLTITNQGTAPLILTGTSLNNAAFSVVGALPGPIAPGASANLTVRCLPPAAVSYSTTLFIFSNGGSAPAGLACRGFAPVLSVPTSLAFGDVRVGGSVDLPLTVTNSGTAPLTVSLATVNNAAFSVVGALPGPLAAGASANLTVRCLPTTAVSTTGALTLTSDGGSAVVGLSCRGLAPILSVSTTRLDFGTLLVGTTSNRTFTVSNTGTAPLLVSSHSLSGADFQLITTLPFTVAPGANKSVTVACGPPTVGSRIGTLTLQHDAGAPVSIALACNATAGQLQVVEPVGTMRLYSSQTGRAMLRNVGTGSLRITQFSILGGPNSASSLRMIGLTLPVTLPPGSLISWSIKCVPTSTQSISATLYATHDGLPTGSLFTITCTPGIVVIDDPVPPIETSATEGPSTRCGGERRRRQGGPVTGGRRCASTWPATGWWRRWAPYRSRSIAGSARCFPCSLYRRAG
ncbi:choice-of-anchor D domain-containing protein [Hyalangium versicolor]|uniref:choice-of-anchor D domain-containing protein n=1 Tax=Hyalangium versicolor TaxID=2861190 RepID=UPI001CCBB987|nr:choice-of-anchor D domain-containing protein [Hyalangium versicolor]